MPQKPRMILLVGPSGTGKGTARAFLQSADDYVIASADDVLLRLAAQNGLSYQAAYAEHAPQSEAEFSATIRSAISEGKNLIIDRTNLTAGKRAPHIIAGKKAGYEVIAMVADFEVDSPEGREILLDRAATRTDRGAPMPAHVVESQIKAYEPPQPKEGFDSILVLPRPQADLTPNSADLGM